MVGKQQSLSGQLQCRSSKPARCAILQSDKRKHSLTRGGGGSEVWYVVRLASTQSLLRCCKATACSKLMECTRVCANS